MYKIIIEVILSYQRTSDPHNHVSKFFVPKNEEKSLTYISISFDPI